MDGLADTRTMTKVCQQNERSRLKTSTIVDEKKRKRRERSVWFGCISNIQPVGRLTNQSINQLIFIKKNISTTHFTINHLKTGLLFNYAFTYYLTVYGLFLTITLRYGLILSIYALQVCDDDDDDDDDYDRGCTSSL